MTIGRIPSVEGGIQPTIFDAKADLLTATANDTPARLAVGTNDQVLVADSSTTTGLAWKSYGAQFVAGKNAVINGAFDFWQRGTSFTLSSGIDTYCADRFTFAAYGSGTAGTVTRQVFTAGAAPVSGYEGQYFARLTNFSTATAWQIRHRIENVQTFAGQTITFSFWAKSGTAVNNALIIERIQNFGSGGSAAVISSITTTNSISTSWTRYTITFSVPSISGKTIGTGSYLEINMYQNSGLTNSNTIDLWGWQVEAGSVATPFTTATGTIQGELAACQRYYYASNAGIVTAGIAPSSVFIYGRLVHPVPMRTTPSGSISSSGTSFTITDDYSAAFTSTSVTGFGNDSWITSTAARVSLSGFTGLTGGRFYSVDGRGAGQIFFSAEL